jgi:hypothetical protein
MLTDTVVSTVLPNGSIKIVHEECPDRPFVLPISDLVDSTPLPVPGIHYVDPEHVSTLEMRQESLREGKRIVDGELLATTSSEKKLVTKKKKQLHRGKSDKWKQQHQRILSKTPSPRDDVPNDSSTCRDIGP